MQIAILNFGKSDYKILVDMLNQYFIFKELKVFIDEFFSTENFFKSFENKKYKLIIIYVSEKANFEVAKKLREYDNDSILIVFADKRDFAFEAFEVYAVDYIVKPILYNRLEQTLNKCYKEFKKSAKYITVNCNKINTKIYISNIIYIEVIGNISNIHTANNNVLKTYVTLSELESVLKDYPLFLRTHKSYIINMEFVQEMKKDCFVMKNGDVVAIRKNNNKTIKNAFNRFYYNFSSNATKN